MKTISFEAHPEIFNAIPHPKPAGQYIPDWYKKMSKMRPSTSHASTPFGETTLKVNMPTVKGCMPVRDYLTSGYIIPAWHDIEIGVSDEGHYYDMTHSARIEKPGPIGIYYHEIDQVKGTPLEQFADGHKLMKLIGPWNIKTPPGYSTFFFSPFYHTSDVTILPAIVDTDTYEDITQFPCIIPPTGCYVEQGTPIIQAVPIKRESWNHTIEASFVRTRLGQLKNQLARSFYRRNNWTSKRYK